MNVYSDPIFAWLYEENGVVYHNELDFPIGRIEKDEKENLKN